VNELKVTRGDVTVMARFWFDDHGRDYCGWYAEYLKDGEVIDDSEKVGHEELSTNPDATNVEGVVRNHARHLCSR
jgi:hypothetical protein